MYFSRSFIATALLGFGAATTHMGEMGASTAVAASETLSNSAAAASSTGAPAGEVATHVIQVGGPNGSLTFSPENIQANVGDLVQFQFHPKNHSVVQSTFDQPCVPIQNVMPNLTTAFYSGFMPTNASVGATSQVLTYTIRVMDAKPVWFYCGQAKHCQSGMVGAINAAATGNKTMTAFKALAARASENLVPGAASGSGSGSSSSDTTSPSGTAGSSGGAGGAGTGATSSSAASPAQQTTNAAPGLYDSRQSLFGLALGGLAAFLVL